MFLTIFQRFLYASLKCRSVPTLTSQKRISFRCYPSILTNIQSRFENVISIFYRIKHFVHLFSNTQTIILLEQMCLKLSSTKRSCISFMPRISHMHSRFTDYDSVEEGSNGARSLARQIPRNFCALATLLFLLYTKWQR